MDILAAYYAPNNPQLVLHCGDKILDHIAYELKFVKNGQVFDNDKKEYFVKNCR
jgi:hypothetical protein